MSETPTGDGRKTSAGQWPVTFEGGVTESVVATLGPNGKWNLAALGLFAGDPVTARTWGNTRTRRNFDRQGEGYVQFIDDPVLFVDAALSITEREEPVCADAMAWARVGVTQIDSGTAGETTWREWELDVVEGAVCEQRVPTINRGFNAVVEATVAVSRLGVTGYEDDVLLKRLEYLASVVDSAGGPREQEALERVREHSAWTRADRSD